MVGKKKRLNFAVICLLVAVLGSISLLSAAPEDERKKPKSSRRTQREQGSSRMGRGRNPQQRQKMMTDRMKKNLGASDEEWTIIEPRLTKVMKLSRETSSGGMAMAMFAQRRGGPGQQRPGQADREQGKVAKATQQLRTTLENKEAKPEEIKARLTAVRKAKEQARQELSKAQQQLREVLSLKQEAQLVLTGMLE